jgi:DNA invertase Pin-like site-specific DNA recombinase
VKLTGVAIYTRVSTDDQSTKTQEHELRQYAKNRGWTVQRVYTDHGFSGASEKRVVFGRRDAKLSPSADLRKPVP